MAKAPSQRVSMFQRPAPVRVAPAQPNIGPLNLPRTTGNFELLKDALDNADAAGRRFGKAHQEKADKLDMLLGRRDYAQLPAGAKDKMSALAEGANDARRAGYMAAMGEVDGRNYARKVAQAYSDPNQFNPDTDDLDVLLAAHLKNNLTPDVDPHYLEHYQREIEVGRDAVRIKHAEYTTKQARLKVLDDYSQLITLRMREYAEHNQVPSEQEVASWKLQGVESFGLTRAEVAEQLLVSAAEVDDPELFAVFNYKNSDGGTTANTRSLGPKISAAQNAAISRKYSEEERQRIIADRLRKEKSDEHLLNIAIGAARGKDMNAYAKQYERQLTSTDYRSARNIIDERGKWNDDPTVVGELDYKVRYGMVGAKDLMDSYRRRDINDRTLARLFTQLEQTRSGKGGLTSSESYKAGEDYIRGRIYTNMFDLDQSNNARRAEALRLYRERMLNGFGGDTTKLAQEIVESFIGPLTLDTMPKTPYEHQIGHKTTLEQASVYYLQKLRTARDLEKQGKKPLGGETSAEIMKQLRLVQQRIKMRDGANQRTNDINSSIPQPVTPAK